MMNILKQKFKLSLIFTMLIGSMGIISYAEAASKSPFAQMAGNWRGSGRVTPPGGEPERVRCKVSYRVFSSGNKARQSIRCAGSGYWITATSSLRYTPGTKKIRGTWRAKYGDRGKPQKKASGNILGDFINNTLSISLISDEVTGNMSVRMNGRRKQTVIIDNIGRLDLRR